MQDERNTSVGTAPLYKSRWPGDSQMALRCRWDPAGSVAAPCGILLWTYYSAL